MAKEIERKFLLKNNDWQPEADKGTVLKQGYLSTDPERTVRVRLVGKKGMLTIKSKNIGITRNEFEYQIPYADTLELLKLCAPPLIEKTRYKIIHQNLLWEIDIFSGENKGLAIAEVELSDEHQTITPPAWLGKEVSAEEKYYNSNLVLHPFKNWERE